jgi:hypothetical protein
MAVVAVNLTPKTYAEIMALVSKGTYVSLEQFVEIALFNQLALEKGATPAELIDSQMHKVLDRGRGELNVENAKLTKTPPRKKALHSAATKQPVSRQRHTTSSLDLVELKQALSQLSLTHIVAGNLPATSESVGIGKERIWGQVNRLLPLKLTCRWIAVMASSKGVWPTLQSVAERLANEAAMIGSALEKADDTKSRRREEMLATGLPRRGNLQSRDRFLSQFLARVTRAGRIYPGAICHYGLAQFDEEHLVLTRAGEELAKLENPVLDGIFDSVNETLSDNERSCFLGQIRTYASMEWNDFKIVMAAIAAGNITPDSLLRSVRLTFPSDWTDVAYRTHIYGVLARISDLRLLSKDWDGRRVKYKLTKSAITLLAA